MNAPNQSLEFEKYVAVAYSMALIVLLVIGMAGYVGVRALLRSDAKPRIASATAAHPPRIKTALASHS
jgi:hypothetical protein